MAQWLGVVGEEQFSTERLYARETIVVPAAPGPGDAAAPVAPGDEVALVAAGPPARLIGYGLVDGQAPGGGVRVRYQGRVFDDPVPLTEFPAADLPTLAGLHPLTDADYRRLVGRVGGEPEGAPPRSVWFVSVALPIEATSRAEAVREFWTYVEKLGPRELPAYVWPLGDELAMQAFVLGAVTNLDPEEDDDGG